MALDRDDVLKLAAEIDLKFVNLQFTDILGSIKNVAIPVDQLEAALDGELMFDGSSIEGFVRIEESDMYLRPDPDTFTVFPWLSEENSTGRLICDVYNPNGTPFAGCPRGILRRAIAHATKLGFELNAGPEPEFFLFRREGGRATTETGDNAGYFDLSPADRGEAARRDMVLTLRQMGFAIEASHHEVAPGQHEIDFHYADALKTADNIATFRFVVRIVASNHDLHATFMPKPVFGISGSGMHIHQSLFTNGLNEFYDPGAPRQLSCTAMYYIGGLMKHARQFAAVTNPNVNSYKRLVPGYEAPVYVAWSERNRSPLIRIPARRGVGTRIELRCPDPSCNPYLALAVTLSAGLWGIENKVDPPDPVDVNIYSLTREQRAQMGVKELPATLSEATTELERSELMREVLGLHVFDRLIHAQRVEWADYRSRVHQWEVDRYLNLF